MQDFVKFARNFCIKLIFTMTVCYCLPPCKNVYKYYVNKTELEKNTDLNQEPICHTIVRNKAFPPRMKRIGNIFCSTIA